MVDDQTNELDEILAEVTTEVEDEKPVAEGQERDASGKFAAKPNADAETGTEEPDEAAGEPESSDAEADGTVPQKALHEARRREREQRERADNIERQFQQMQGQMQLLMQQRQQPQQQPSQMQAPPSFWENPDKWGEHLIAPVQQQLHQQIMHNARLIAENVHGSEQVGAAVQEFDGLLHSGQIDQAEAAKIMQSPNPFVEAVTWHQRRQLLNEVGSDPKAYRAKLEAEIRAQLEAEMGGAAPVNGQPTSTKPLTKLPQSLSRLPGGGNGSGGGDVSDAALFNSAMSGR